MLHHRSMLLQRKRTTPIDVSLLFTRQFSVAHRPAKDISNQGSKNVVNRSNSSTVSPSRVPSKTNVPPSSQSKATHFDRPRPRRVVDARSLGTPQAGGPPANVLRIPRLRNRNGPPAYRHGNRNPTKPSASKGRKEGRSLTAKHSDMDDGDVVQRTEIEDGYRKLAERTKTVPSHYSPQAPALSSLVETWPSFPTNVTGYSAGILKTLLWLSDRTPNGYVPPYELGSRLFNGRYVYFLDQEENNQASMEAMKLSQQSADKNSQRKGGLVEPKEVHFEPINTESRNALLQSFVQGSYPKNDHVGKPALVVDAMKNLKNNETYVTAGKSLQFISKLESLLASNRPVKSV